MARTESFKLVVYDPVGQPEATGESRPRKALNGVKDKSVGYIFNGHASAAVFWKRFEEVAEEVLQPRQSHRVYKQNTFAPAPKEQVEEVARVSDYALVGVGA